MVTTQRAQLVLVGAVVVAVAVLGAVALLNTIHSSPEAVAETDTRSVADAENALTEIENNLGKVAANRTFTGPRGPLRFVGNETELEQNLWAYENQSLNLTTTDSANLISVEYDDDASQEGAIAYNESVDEDSEEFSVGGSTIVDGSDEIRFYLQVEDYDSNGGEPIVQAENENLEFGDPDEITGWGFDYEADFDDDIPLEIEMDSEEGEIRSSETGEVYDRSTNPPWQNEDDVEISFFNIGNDEFDVSYEITGIDGGCGDVPDQCLDDVVVSPVFDVTFQNPNVAVDSKITLWGGL